MTSLKKYIKKPPTTTPEKPYTPPPPATSNVARPSDLPPGNHYASRDRDLLVKEYAYLWQILKVDEKFKPAALAIARKLLGNKERYEKVARAVAVNMPWWFVAIIHQMESSINFQAALHNGDKIIGTGKKTTRVPKGKGPFATWEEGAIDALQEFRGYTDWSLPLCFFRLEQYNGWGYRTGAGRNTRPPNASAYIWSGTDQFHSGKYITDGKFDPYGAESRPASMAILRTLVQLDPSLSHLDPDSIKLKES